MITWTEDAIRYTIRNTILFEGLELDGLGVRLEDLTGETMLLSEQGLALDSVDALEIIVALQKVFGLSIPDLDTTFFETNLHTVGTLVDYVVAALDIAPEDV
jgi:acyl carrier protein